jgi:hypothetical protein
LERSREIGFHRAQVAKAVSRSTDPAKPSRKVSSADRDHDIAQAKTILYVLSTGHQSHKRSFEGDDMEQDRSAKRSRQTPPVEGLPVPVFENKQTLWSRGKNNFDETDQIEHMSVRGTSQVGNGQLSLGDMRNTQLMPAAHLDEDISSLLEIVFNENERGYPVNYSLPLESAPMMDTMQDSDHQQLNIRRALFDTSFLYDLGRTT